jgi:phosphoglycerol transferase
MVLPIDDHRVPALARIRARYRAGSTNGDNESNMAALGIVGVVGLLLSISAVLLDWPRSRRRRSGTPEGDESVSLGLLGVLTVSGILLGTVSGFGALIAGFVSPQIRAYDRISVFIALFAFVTLGVLADRLIRRRTDRAWRLAAPMAVAIVVLVGVLDQTPADLRPDVASSAEWAADVAFGRDVEGTVPSGASVFQLPYMPFPESWPIYGMTGYDPFRGYIHTSGLRWSFGAVNGRPDAAWQEATAELPTAAMIQRLRASGFSAVWVQLNGYEDGGAAIRRELDDVLGPPVLTRSDGVVALWRL